MEMIKVGLCAFGMSGKVFHAPFIKEHPGFALSAIVERHREDSKEKYTEAEIYVSVEEMLKKVDIDLVVVNTPVQTHFQYAEMCLEARKNIIVEKPFTVNTEEAEELTLLSHKNERFLSVFQNRRFDRDFLQVRKILNSGQLGTIREAEIRFDRFRTTPSGKIHKENFYLPGSGALHDLGSHLIDQAVILFGFPQKVFGDIFTMKQEQTANDYFEIILFYEFGLRVRLKSSVFVKEDHYAYKIFGDKGSFLQERSDMQEQVLAGATDPIFMESWLPDLIYNDGILNIQNDIRQELKSEAGDYMQYYQDIYKHVVFGYPLPSPGSEIVGNMKIIDAVLKSSKEGKIIEL